MIRPLMEAALKKSRSERKRIREQRGAVDGAVCRQGKNAVVLRTRGDRVVNNRSVWERDGEAGFRIGRAGRARLQVVGHFSRRRLTAGFLPRPRR
jgi:hypothetical protein